MVLLAVCLLATSDRGLLLRLNLHAGEKFAYNLLVERSKPKESGALTMNYKVAKVDGNTIYIDASFSGLKINKKDRTKDLKAIVGNQTVTMPWTIYSRRTGSMTPLHMQPGKPDVMSILSEAGIYLAYFQKQSAKIGDSWDGSTTATGGCTGGMYALKQVKTIRGKKLAYFDVTGIRFADPANRQIGPMKMIVDLSTGLPTIVDYKVENIKTRRLSHFRQTIA